MDTSFLLLIKHIVINKAQYCTLQLININLPIMQLDNLTCKALRRCQHISELSNISCDYRSIDSKCLQYN